MEFSGIEGTPKERKRLKGSKWESITNNILMTNQDQFRDFLKSVNEAMYSELMKFGERCCSGFSLTRKGRRGSEVSNSSHSKEMKKGIKMLRDIIKQKIMSKRRKEKSEVEEAPPQLVNKHTLITPLVYLSRVNQMNGQNRNLESENFRNFETEKMLKTTGKMKFTPISKLI